MIDHRDPDVLVIVGRPTFDLESAAPLVSEALAWSDPATVLVGNGRILQSPEEVESAMSSVPSTARTLVVLFASFTDSRLGAAAVDHFDTVANVVLWSLPEEWTGGRLRRNSLCGANLLAYRLVREGREVAAIHELPSAATQRSLEQAVIRENGRRSATSLPSNAELTEPERALVSAVVDDLHRSRIGVIGDPPDGFEPCEAEESALPEGAVAGRVPLGRLFATAGRPLSVADDAEVSQLRDLAGNESIERAAIEQTVAFHRGAERLADREGWNALAIRCWPECFDEWGGAVCAAMALLNEQGIPAACEADIFGALSMRMMQRVAGAPTFLADLVDVELDGDRVAFWHCGVAPRTLADPSGVVRVALHPNRQVPAVFDFGLAPGPVTIARLSQTPQGLRMVVGQGRIEEGQPFQGTSCVVQLPTSARSLLSTLLGDGLEHHFVLAPGHHRRIVEAVAAELSIPMVCLT